MHLRPQPLRASPHIHILYKANHCVKKNGLLCICVVLFAVDGALFACPAKSTIDMVEVLTETASVSVLFNLVFKSAVLAVLRLESGAYTSSF